MTTGPVPPSSWATSDGIRRTMQGNKRAGTEPERRLRAELHRRGLRFRKDLLLKAAGVRTHADVVFTRQHVAVYVDGCFWHRCPLHATTPARNADYWIPKLEANVERDRRVNDALKLAGWRVVRIWEHETVHEAADRVEEALAEARSHAGPVGGSRSSGLPDGTRSATPRA